MVLHCYEWKISQGNGIGIQIRIILSLGFRYEVGKYNVENNPVLSDSSSLGQKFPELFCKTLAPPGGNISLSGIPMKILAVADPVLSNRPLRVWASLQHSSVHMRKPLKLMMKPKEDSTSTLTKFFPPSLKRTCSYSLMILTQELDVIQSFGMAWLERKEWARPVPMEFFSWPDAWNMV